MDAPRKSGLAPAARRIPAVGTPQLLALHHVSYWVTYHPASRFPLLQGVAGLFLVMLAASAMVIRARRLRHLAKAALLRQESVESFPSVTKATSKMSWWYLGTPPAASPHRGLHRLELSIRATILESYGTVMSTS